jgi:hypothetical protein
MLTWTRGKFYFRIEKLPDDLFVEGGINMEFLLLECTRCADENAERLGILNDQ